MTTRKPRQRMYAISLVATKLNGSCFTHASGVVVTTATSEDEAFGVGHRHAEDNWPAANGWRHTVTVLEVSDKTIAKVAK